jgi:small-conductance mechanosensitive channel
MQRQVLIDGLGWMPNWLIGGALLLAAAVIAASLHGLIVRTIRRFLRENDVFLHLLLSRTQGPTRFALVIFAVGATLPLVPLDRQATAIIGKVLSIAFIILVGWVAATALNLAVTLYLRRFERDMADDLLARKQVTQTRILRRAAGVLIMLITVAAALMTIDPVRQYGVSLLAAGGAAGLIVGLAAQPVLSNLFAGLQLAITQPIRINDAVIVEGEWGTIEDITATYVVIKVWDWRRLVVPLKYFIEKPFQNWTRDTASLIGVVTLHVDYRAPVDSIRKRLAEIARSTPLWDGQVVNLQVVEAYESTMQLRALVSARNAPTAWDLRCVVREQLIDFLQAEHPEALPRRREEVLLEDAAASDRRPAFVSGERRDGEGRRSAEAGRR